MFSFILSIFFSLRFAVAFRIRFRLFQDFLVPLEFLFVGRLFDKGSGLAWGADRYVEIGRAEERRRREH
jgi:hypothetical protein